MGGFPRTLTVTHDKLSQKKGLKIPKSKKAKGLKQELAAARKKDRKIFKR